MSEMVEARADGKAHTIPEHRHGCAWHPVVQYYAVWIGITYVEGELSLTASFTQCGDARLDILEPTIWDAREALDDLFERPSPSVTSRLTDAYHCIRASQPLGLEVQSAMQSWGPYRYGRRIKKLPTSDQQFGVWE